MTDLTVSPPPVPALTEVSPQLLEGDLLNQRAWRMPDMVIYQHAPEEWWVAPLDEELPLIRLNRMGAALLGAMDGRMTIGALLNQFGKWVCSPDSTQWSVAFRTMGPSAVFVSLLRDRATQRA